MDKKTLGVGIIGCGLIGAKRAAQIAPARLVACADIACAKAQALARMHSGVRAVADWRAVIDDNNIKIVIIATTNDMLALIAKSALEAGKHVLIEKPGARSAAEFEPLLTSGTTTGALARIGFNHRYHPAMLKAMAIVRTGAIGDLMFIRARYGHGGRIGYDREWRADPAISGGGELLDQGAHLIDLARMFLGDFNMVTGLVQTCYWDMPVEDNAFLMLQTAANQTAWIHASCTEWKNLFSMEIYGRTGKLHVEGLGGSYGVERLAFYRMLPGMGPPETTIWEYPMLDRSWHVEFQEFLDDIRLGRPPVPGPLEAMAVLKIIADIYKKSPVNSMPVTHGTA